MYCFIMMIKTKLDCFLWCLIYIYIYQFHSLCMDGMEHASINNLVLCLFLHFTFAWDAGMNMTVYSFWLNFQCFHNVRCVCALMPWLIQWASICICSDWTYEGWCANIRFWIKCLFYNCVLPQSAVMIPSLSVIVGNHPASLPWYWPGRSHQPS